MNTTKLTTDILKDKAKQIRLFLKEKQTSNITHGHCLDLISIIYGFKDWNTASALLSKNHTNETAKTKIDTVGELRKKIADLPDNTPLDAEHTIDTVNFLQELEIGQSKIHYEFSVSLEVEGDTEKFATLNLKVEHESAEFDQDKIGPTQNAMASCLGLTLKGQ